MRKRELTAFGKAVKTAAVERDMTLTQVASLAGVRPTYLYRIMVGDRAGTKYRRRIIEVLELPKKWEASA